MKFGVFLFLRRRFLCGLLRKQPLLQHPVGLLDTHTLGRGKQLYRGPVAELPAHPVLDLEQLPLGRTEGQLVRLDRKSTRLNSSHVRISYAVFCLKKKNKQTHETPSVRSI